jgi:sugar O-acyltransferase (sialic acid O-acetyltransferase NeuD family)
MYKKDINKVRIYGAGGHSQVIRSVLEDNNFIVPQVFDDKPSGKHHASKNVVPGAKDLIESFEHEGYPLIIAIGNNLERAEIAHLLKCDYEMAIHKSAIISNSSKIGKGTVVFAGAIIQPNTHIGEHVIINTGASVDHDNILGNFVHISPKAALCGHVEVGEGSHVGVGAVVIPKVKIGKWCTIGAGTVVLSDVPDYATVVGNPGKIIKIQKPKFNFNSHEAPECFDIAFIGSGISSSFTILHFLEGLEEKKSAKPIKIALIEKNKEFFTGIPYGNRSGSSSLLITSLADFLPQPELGKFISWLNENKVWLLDEFKKDGGILTEKWLIMNKKAIENNAWENLFIPRRFFGRYINEKVSKTMEEARISGSISYEMISMNVDNVLKVGDDFKIIGEENTVLTQRVVLGIGSPPPKKIWETKMEETQEESKLLLISNPYLPSLDDSLEKISNFLDKRNGLKTNVLIVGANASALELLYKQNDYQNFSKRINKFIFLSSHGLTPDSEIDHVLDEKFKPSNLIALKEAENITAKKIAEACFQDLELAHKIGLGAATTVKPISKAFGELLNHLNDKELENFACFYGNEIGRRQRCAGIHYTNTILDLKTSGQFEHLAGGFDKIINKSDFDFSFQYTDTLTQNKKAYHDTIHIVINCIGSITLASEDIPSLYKNIINSGLCEPNKSLRGFKVNDKLEVNAKNCHLIGPLLAGNVIQDKPVWHVEHCGRIIWTSKILAKSMLKEFKLKEEEIHFNTME